MLKLLLTFLCLLPVVASADTFYVEQASQGSSVSAAVERLVKNELTTKGHAVVANAENSQWSLSADTVNIGNTYIVTLTKSQGNKVVYSDKLKSTGLDDLDIVSIETIRNYPDILMGESWAKRQALQPRSESVQRNFITDQASKPLPLRHHKRQTGKTA